MARGRRSSTSLLVLLLFCAGLLHSAVAKTTHIVGGDKRWTTRNITATFYDEWAAQQKFQVDDELLFVYPAGIHNVWVVTPIDLESCTTSNSVEKYENANATIQLYRSGEFAFVCEYLGHCQSGMKMKLTVEASGPAAGPAQGPGEAPVPEPGSPPAPANGEAPQTPEPPPETTAPPPSAASSLQSLAGLAAGGLLWCLAAVFIL